MKLLATLLTVVASTASAGHCDDVFLFSEKIMRQYQKGENIHVLLSQAGEDKELASIVDDAFEYQVPKLATDKLEQSNQFAIKHFDECGKTEQSG